MESKETSRGDYSSQIILCHHYTTTKINKIINTKRTVLILNMIFAFQKVFELLKCILILTNYLELVVNFYVIADWFM